MTSNLADNGTGEDLNAFFIAFLNAGMHINGVANVEFTQGSWRTESFSTAAMRGFISLLLQRSVGGNSRGTSPQRPEARRSLLEVLFICPRGPPRWRCRTYPRTGGRPRWGFAPFAILCANQSSVPVAWGSAPADFVARFVRAAPAFRFFSGCAPCRNIPAWPSASAILCRKQPSASGAGSAPQRPL